MNETIRAILGRRTVHHYRDDAVPQDVLHAALACAVRAPNHKLTNPWRFTRVGPHTRPKITELAVAVKREKGPLSEAQERKIRSKVGSSAELLVASMVRTDDAFRAREDYAACACAIQNLSVALASEGVASKWSTGGATRDDRAYEILEIDSEVEEIIGFIWIGYPQSPAEETPRAPLSDVFRSLP